MIESSLLQLIDKGLEIDARGEVGSAGNADICGSFEYRHCHHWNRFACNTHHFGSVPISLLSFAAALGVLPNDFNQCVLEDQSFVQTAADQPLICNEQK